MNEMFGCHNLWTRLPHPLPSSPQAVHERDVQIRQLHQECEEAQSEHHSKSITASDMDREINRLKKVSNALCIYQALPRGTKIPDLVSH